MSAVRVLRVVAVAALFALLFNVSQQVTLYREGTTTPGIGWAMGVISTLFSIRAFVSEKTAGPEHNLQKDFHYPSPFLFWW